jgi:hypothetical protein
METNMKVVNENSGELSDRQLEGIAGGQGIDFKTKLPNYQGPKLGRRQGARPDRSSDRKAVCHHGRRRAYGVASQ